MFAALHPLLLWGTAAVAVPVLIHLLLRQRPRPRPWAAMRWLLAAAQAAQRRYRLTNLLLLLLRCLIMALIALAVMRPSIAGLGGGDRLVLIVDRSASMGARGNDPGPLAAAKAALARADLSYRTVVLVAVAERPEEIASGSLAEAIAAIARVDASELPGGLDRCAIAPYSDQVSTLVGTAADVVLISDFQQDDGELLSSLLAPRCRSLARWRVGSTCANALVTGVENLDDLKPGQPGELVLRVAGNPRSVAIAADDGPFLPSPGSASGGLVRVSTPPLTPGEHRLRVRLEDDGLAYDNLLELPVAARAAVQTLSVAEHPDFLGAALLADTQSLHSRVVRPAQFPAEPLPAGGLVALRTAVADSVHLRDWVLAGGVLWAGFERLNDDPALRDLTKGIVIGEEKRAGGAYRTGEKDVDEVMRLASRETAPQTTLPPSAEVLLRAGDAPLVVALPAGRGWVVVELVALGNSADQSFQARGTTPLWVSRVTRRYTARLGAPRFWQAGLPAPIGIALKRGGSAVGIRAGEPLLLPPGAWQAEDGPVVVLPNVGEGQLQKAPPTGAVTALEAALPRRPGIDWGMPLLIVLLVVAVGEGLFAAWAGRAYGR